MEGKFIFLNLCLLFVLVVLLVQKYKRVYETYNDYFNEDLFRTINKTNENMDSDRKISKNFEFERTDSVLRSPIEILANNTELTTSSTSNVPTTQFDREYAENQFKQQFSYNDDGSIKIAEDDEFTLKPQSSEGSYSDDPKASVCFDRYKSAQELGTVNANNRYINLKKEISKKQFIIRLNDLSETYRVSERNKNLLALPQCNDNSPTSCVKKKEYLDLDPTTNSTYDLCKNWLLDRLNEKIREYDQEKGNEYIPFTVQRDTILKFKQIYEIPKTNIDYFNYLFTINRNGKNKVFTINTEMIYDKNADSKSIISLKLDGLTTNENSITGFMEFHRNGYYDCDDNGISCTISDRPECKPPSDNEINRRREEEASANQRERDSKCFYKEAQTEAHCISVDAIGCSGVWDTKCSADTDCPFFGAKGNTNYTNNRGGCKENGHCELPLNMINIGYRKYSTREEDRPLCHNCPRISNCIGKECSQCCHLQGENPDYAFEFDKPFRERERGPYKEKFELEEKGLKHFDLYF